MRIRTQLILTLDLLVALCLLPLGATGATGHGGAGEPRTSVVELGAQEAPRKQAAQAGPLVFRNTGQGSTRLVIARKDTEAFDCEADGQEAIRSRSGQFLLRRGAELACRVGPGRYRYTTVTLSGNRVREARTTLDVRNP